MGPDALKIASLEYGQYFFGKFKRKEIRDSSLLLYKNPIRTHAKRIRGIVDIFQKLARTVNDELKEGSFPVILSGDHSSASGIAGVKMAFPDKRLGVIWVDAHADIHSPFTTPSGNVHGMPVAASLGIDNLDDAQNVLADDRTREYWNNLKRHRGHHAQDIPAGSGVHRRTRHGRTEINFIRKKRIKVIP